MIVRMIVAPNKTVVDSDWCFEENTVNFRLQAPYLKSPPAISSSTCKQINISRYKPPGYKPPPTPPAFIEMNSIFYEVLKLKKLSKLKKILVVITMWSY